MPELVRQLGQFTFEQQLAEAVKLGFQTEFQHACRRLGVPGAPLVIDGSVLDLRQSGMTDAHLEAIAWALRVVPLLERLDIRENAISTAGAAPLCDTLRWHLHLSRQPLTPAGVYGACVACRAPVFFAREAAPVVDCECGRQVFKPLHLLCDVALEDDDWDANMLCPTLVYRITRLCRVLRPANLVLSMARFLHMALSMHDDRGGADCELLLRSRCGGRAAADAINTRQLEVALEELGYFDHPLLAAALVAAGAGRAGASSASFANLLEGVRQRAVREQGWLEYWPEHVMGISNGLRRAIFGRACFNQRRLRLEEVDQFVALFLWRAQMFRRPPPQLQQHKWAVALKRGLDGMGVLRLYGEHKWNVQGLVAAVEALMLAPVVRALVLAVDVPLDPPTLDALRKCARLHYDMLTRLQCGRFTVRHPLLSGRATCRIEPPGIIHRVEPDDVLMVGPVFFLESVTQGGVAVFAPPAAGGKDASGEAARTVTRLQKQAHGNTLLGWRAAFMDMNVDADRRVDRGEMLEACEMLGMPVRVRDVKRVMACAAAPHSCAKVEEGVLLRFISRPTSELDLAATTIQACWRGGRFRRKLGIKRAVGATPAASTVDAARGGAMLRLQLSGTLGEEADHRDGLVPADQELLVERVLADPVALSELLRRLHCSVERDCGSDGGGGADGSDRTHSIPVLREHAEAIAQAFAAAAASVPEVSERPQAASFHAATRRMQPWHTVANRSAQLGQRRQQAAVVIQRVFRKWLIVRLLHMRRRAVESAAIFMRAALPLPSAELPAASNAVPAACFSAPLVVAISAVLPAQPRAGAAPALAAPAAGRTASGSLPALPPAAASTEMGATPARKHSRNGRAAAELGGGAARASTPATAAAGADATTMVVSPLTHGPSVRAMAGEDAQAASHPGRKLLAQGSREAVADWATASPSTSGMAVPMSTRWGPRAGSRARKRSSSRRAGSKPATKLPSVHAKPT